MVSLTPVLGPCSALPPSTARIRPLCAADFRQGVGEEQEKRQRLPSARNHNTLTIGGIGQGVETQHDVWRGIAYHVLDRIRIREADLSGGRVRLVADLEDAYPPAAGVVGFTRTLTWDGKATFAVADADAATLMSPKPVEWHLQSDTPVVAIGNGHRIGKPGKASLLVSFSSPAALSVTAAARSHGESARSAGLDRERSGRTTRVCAARDLAGNDFGSLRGDARGRPAPMTSLITSSCHPCVPRVSNRQASGIPGRHAIASAAGRCVCRIRRRRDGAVSAENDSVRGCRG